MARAIGGWLSGPPLPADYEPGVRLGLPADGPGSVAGTGLRIGAFLVDAIIANLLVGIFSLFGVSFAVGTRGWVVLGIFLVVELLFDTAFGQTLGKRMLGIRVIRVDGRGLASFPWLLLRTVLLGVLVPAVVWDRDRRGLHDKAAGTVVVIDPNRAQSAKPPAPARTGARPAARQGEPGRGPARQEKKIPAGAGKRPAKAAVRRRKRR